MKTSNAISKQLGNNKGFTLIEMAIVLVIIGIIIGAVVKGQDLIANAQAKQLSSAVNSWRSLSYAYMDRNGRLPGDFGRDGIIGNAAATEQIVGGSSIAELVATMPTAPLNPVVIGSMSFWIYFGNVPGATGTRNAIVICPAVACGTAFTTDQLEIIKSLDTAIDGSADAGLGQMRGATAVTLVGGLAAQNGRANDVVTTATVANVTAAGATAAWATTHVAAVWVFDRPY